MGGHRIDPFMAKVAYLRKLFWNAIYSNIVVSGILACFIVLLAGGIMTTTTMNSMKTGMDDMNGQMSLGSKAATKFITGLKGKFPINQPEVTTRQLLGTVDNIHKITARAQFLLNHIKPETIATTVEHINMLMGAVSAEEVQSIKGHIVNIIDKIDQIVTSIPPEKITDLLTTISSLDSVKINSLVDMIGKLHEIKIQL
ncbi:hypothetical protein OAB94_02770 [Flavobacteriaceae bacterium]|nr:hypothetical protein [Flavobacteriaceae bacterium]